MIPAPSMRWKLALFAALSAADFVLTWCLLERHAGSFYESNPLAQWFLAQSGWAGLAAFKAAIVVVVVSAALLVFRRRAGAGRGVLTFACLATGLVVVYSGLLLHRPSAASRTQDEGTIAAVGQQLDGEFQILSEYRRLVEQLGEDYYHGRCTLEEAADRLAATQRACDPRWIKLLQRRYPNRPYRECLAANMLDHLRIRLDFAAQQAKPPHKHPLPLPETAFTGEDTEG
jgi:hypothetical protein